MKYLSDAFKKVKSNPETEPVTDYDNNSVDKTNTEDFLTEEEEEERVPTEEVNRPTEEEDSLMKEEDSLLEERVPTEEPEYSLMEEEDTKEEPEETDYESKPETVHMQPIPNSLSETPNVITITIPKVGGVDRITIDTIGYNPEQWRIVQYLLKHDVKWLDMEVWEMEENWIAIGAITNKSGRPIEIDPKLSNTLLIKQIVESEEEDE